MFGSLKKMEKNIQKVINLVVNRGSWDCSHAISWKQNTENDGL